jgi:hypothetical protein
MDTKNRIAIAIMLLLLLPGCTSEAIKRGTYEAAYQKACMDRTGNPNCDPEHKSYDQYKRDRETIIKQEDKPDKF